MRRVAVVTLSGALVAGLGTTARLASRPLAAVVLPDAPSAAGAPARATASRLPAESGAAHAVARDAFRVSRQPSPVAYDPLAAVQPDVPPPPRPTLQLVGIVWDGGTDPTAVIEGLPGSDGPRTVRRHERVGDLGIRTIARDHVIVLAPDTTWILTVREPWK